MPLLSLGNIQLDQVLGGGIEEDRCTMLVGDPGSGKTTLALQFITDPTVSHLPCAYICIDKKPEKIMEKAIHMDGSVNDNIQSGLLKFVEISIQEWDPEQSINELLLTIQLQVDALFRNFNAKRVIIDSILPHSLFGFSKENKQYFIREFLQIIHTYPTTSIGLLYDVESHHSLWLDTNIISDQLIFQRKADLDYVTYWLEVSKNNLTNKSGRYRFTFDDNKGIKLKHRLC
ncbi:MAG: ATPase domain-containing protein [Candidatus Margulisiibacteriota bacterium]|nr:ATPase domain-containing protein [Candidatus Margulisiibacteriota bacterium]